MSNAPQPEPTDGELVAPEVLVADQDSGQKPRNSDTIGFWIFVLVGSAAWCYALYVVIRALL